MHWENDLQFAVNAATIQAVCLQTHQQLTASINQSIKPYVLLISPDNCRFTSIDC